MSTIFKARKNADEAGSGGKIRRKRVLETRSPYARPTTSSSSSPPTESPNRLLGLISPASRVITGAAKIISTVFFPESPSSSSSEDDSDDDISSQGDERSNQQNGATPEANFFTEKNLQLTLRKNEVKLAIEQLLMQETFSREERDKLVKIIESRVVDAPAAKEGGDASRIVLTDRAIGSSFTLPGGHVSDICNTAVMEAKKWVEEKKIESSSHSEKNQGTFNSNPCLLSTVTAEELGSPVLMAKSYMKSRPPWTSPTVGHTGFQTSPPIGVYSKEETPYSVGAHALSSSKDLKRSNAAIDSWNTLDGSRRVRFKTTVDTLESFPVKDSSQKDKKISEEDERRDDEFSSDSLPRTRSGKQPVAFSMDFPKENASLVYDGSGHETLTMSPTLPIDEHNQVLDGTQRTVQGGGTTQFAEDLIPDAHDGLPVQSAATVNSKINMASDEIKPAVQSDSNDLPAFVGTDELGLKPKGKNVVESCQTTHSFGLKGMESFDANAIKEQPIEDNERCLPVSSDNLSRVEKIQASAEMAAPPVINVSVVEGNLPIDNDQHKDVETQISVSSVSAHCVDMHDEDPESVRRDDLVASSHDNHDFTIGLSRRSILVMDDDHRNEQVELFTEARVSTVTSRSRKDTVDKVDANIAKRYSRRTTRPPDRLTL